MMFSSAVKQWGEAAPGDDAALSTYALWMRESLQTLLLPGVASAAEKLAMSGCVTETLKSAMEVSKQIDEVDHALIDKEREVREME